jgi:hypothetical protein
LNFRWGIESLTSHLLILPIFFSWLTYLQISDLSLNLWANALR